MRRALGFLVVVPLLFVFATGVALGWQGRMAGMGDPFGLVADESDFLIHPALIADGQGLKVYAHYGYQYRRVTDWNWGFDLNGAITSPLFAPISGIGLSGRFDQDGTENHHQGLLGAAFPLGAGKMGVFFTYKGKRSDFDGDEGLTASIPAGLLGANPLITAGAFFSSNQQNDLDDFALRLLYGAPLGGGFKLGAEIDVAYISAKNEFSNTFTNAFANVGGALFTVAPPVFNWNMNNQFWGDMFPFGFPYDSNYWDTTFKMSLDGKVGPAKFGLTARGGVVVSGDNNWDYSESISLPTVIPGGIFANNRFDLDGGVSGWKVGGDFWLRYPIDEALSLPFLVRVDYGNLRRDGNALGQFDLTAGGAGGLALAVPLGWDYSSSEKTTNVEVGGGFDMALSKSTRLAAGLYYNYIHNKSDLNLDLSLAPVGLPVLVNLDYAEYPDSTEHRMVFKFVGETVMSPSFTLRGGLNGFYGWVSEDYRFQPNLTSTVVPGLTLLTNRASADGSHWGIGASFGASIKTASLTFEPYINGGYQELSVDDGGAATNVLGGLVNVPWDIDKQRKEWFIGGGLSVLFGP